MRLIGEIKNEKIKDLLERTFWDATITVGKDNVWMQVDMPHCTGDDKKYTKSYIIAVRMGWPDDTLTIGSLEMCYKIDTWDLISLTEFYNGWRKIKKEYAGCRLFWALNDDEWFDFAGSFDNHPDDNNPYKEWKRKMKEVSE